MGLSLVGIIIVVILLAIAAAALFAVSGSKRVCPFCHTMMPKKTVKCPHCRKAIPVAY